MRTTKKILSMILALVLVLGLLPAAALAAEEDVVYLSVSFDDEYIVSFGFTQKMKLLNGK